MKVKLDWVDRNANTIGTRIYRSETPFDKDTLPEVLTTVGQGVTDYVDATVIPGKLYYYIFEAFTDKLSSFSVMKTVHLITDTGHGPQAIRAGDANKGYFGTVSQEDFITHQALYDWSGLVGGIVNVTTPLTQPWFKYAYEGKVCFIPFNHIVSRVSWDSLYEAGLVYGEDSNGPITMETPVNQNKIITIGGKNYRVRLQRAFKESLLEGVTGAWVKFEREGYDERCAVLPNLHKVNSVIQDGFKYSIDITTGQDGWVAVAHSTTEDVKNAVCVDYVAGTFARLSKNRADFTWIPVLELIPTY